MSLRTLNLTVLIFVLLNIAWTGDAILAGAAIDSRHCKE